MKTICVIQARTGSSRLPGKVLADLAGRPMLAFMLEHLRGLPVDELIVATSGLARDDAVADVGDAARIPVVRGDENDVLARFATVLDFSPADLVVRLTADCPFADPEVIGSAIDLAVATNSDYVSNSVVRTFPHGLDVEVVPSAALLIAHAEATDPFEREHVLPFIYRRPERFRATQLVLDEFYANRVWAVDTAEDLERVREIVVSLGGRTRFGWREALSVSPVQQFPAGLSVRRAIPSDANAISRALALSNQRVGDVKEIKEDMMALRSRFWVALMDEEPIACICARMRCGVAAMSLIETSPLMDSVKFEVRKAFLKAADGDPQIATIEPDILE